MQGPRRNFTASEDRIIRAALLVSPPMSIIDLAKGFRRWRQCVQKRAAKLGYRGPHRIIDNFVSRSER